MSFICIVCRDLLTNRPDGHGPGTVDVIATKCGHLYHLFCLTEWFRRKVDVAHTNYECPYCCAIVTQNDILRIFPSEDEETEEIAAKFNEAKANKEDNEIQKLKSRLEEYRAKHDEEQLAHESLKFDYALKLSEIEQLKRDHEVDLSLLDSPQAQWKAMLDKERKAKNKILKTMTTLEKRFAKQKSETEKAERRKTDESQKHISELKAHNESLKKKLERLSNQQIQQPFRPVFPTPASAPSTSTGPVSMSVISSSSSSQSRRRSATNPPQAMIFCPNVSSSQNQGSSVYGMPNFRPPGGQSHFLNPPNPAQNPYQNLLSAAAAAASSAASSNPNQSRNNSSNGNNFNSNQNQNSSSSSSSSSQSHFQNPNASGNNGASSGFNNPNFPSPFPLPQAHNPNLHSHPPPMHLSMHYPSFYLSNSSRNRYPPTPYSFPGAPHIPSSASSSQINGGEGPQSTDSNNAAAAAARLLPAHVQFYMQTATTAGMTETVGVASSYPSFLTPNIHPPPLSPRH